MLKVLPWSCCLLVIALAAPVDALADSFAGRWKLVAESSDDDEKHEYDLILKPTAAGGLAGEIRGGIGRHSLSNVRTQGSSVDFEVTIPHDGEDIVFAVRLEAKGADTLVGRWQVKADARIGGECKAQRVKTPSFVGKWKVVARSPDGFEEYPSTIEITQGKNGKLGGKGSSEQGTADLRSVRCDGSKVGFEITLEFDGQAVTFAIAAKFDGADGLVGKWSVKDRDDVVGEWKAKRVATKKTPMGAAAGQWAVDVEMPDGSIGRFVAEFKVTAAGRVTGTIGARGAKAMKIRNGRIDGDKIRYSFEYLEDNGRETTVEIEAQLDNKNRMHGTWSSGIDFGDWKAVRRTVI